MKLGVLSLLTFSIVGLPVCVHAQENQNPPVVKKETKEKVNSIPFRGKVKSVDKTAKSITIGSRTFQITADTKLIKAGKPATLDDAVIGEEVGGAYVKADDGKLNATMVRFGLHDAGNHQDKSETKSAN